MVDDRASAAEVGDEPLLIARRAGVPVCVGRNRPAVARALLAAHPEVNLILSDDGLQHYALARDIEIVLADARGAGNGWLLPAGPLREPVTRRRDFSVINSAPAAAPAFAMTLVGGFAERLNNPDERRPLTALSGQRMLAAAGIGNPARVFHMLEQAGLRCETLALPDHYPFTENPFAASTADLILITEKDAVKCRLNEALKHDPRIWVVPVDACIAPLNGGTLAERIVQKLRDFPPA
jgi:tetraacyldisaccharide 4'-kinase